MDKWINMKLSLKNKKLLKLYVQWVNVYSGYHFKISSGDATYNNQILHSVLNSVIWGK